MDRDLLKDAETVLRNNYAGVEDVLDAYGVELVRAGKLPELVELFETYPGGSGRDAVANWIKRADFENGHHPEGDTGDPLADVDLVNLSDFLEDPDAFKPPETVAYGVAYEGQVTLLYGDPKGGKSTTAEALNAAVSSGERWMHHPTPEGPVLYLAAEGDRRQVLRRHHEFGGSAENVDVVMPGVDPIEELRALLQTREYRVVVADTLGKWIAPFEKDHWKQSDLNPVLTQIERVVRKSGTSLVALHHANSEGKPIDSTAFAAWADVLRRIEDGENERERVITGRARFQVPDLRFQLFEDEDGSELVPVDGDRDVKNRILDFLRSNDGASTRAIREGVDARASVVDEALEELRGSKIVVDRDGPAMKHRIRQ